MTAVLTPSAGVITDNVSATVRRQASPPLSGDGQSGPAVCSNPIFAGGSTAGWSVAGGGALTAPVSSSLGPAFSRAGQLVGATGAYCYVSLANVQPDLGLTVTVLNILTAGVPAASFVVRLYDPTVTTILATATFNTSADLQASVCNFTSTQLTGYTNPVLLIAFQDTASGTLQFVLQTCQPPGDSSFGVWPATTNLVTNNGFETNTSGWAAEQGVETLTRVTVINKFGTACMRVDTTAANQVQGTYYVWSGGGAVGSNTFTCSLWFIGIGGLTYNLRVNGDGGASRAASNGIVATGNWQRVSVTATMVADTTLVLILERTARAGLESLWLDGVQVEAGVVATPYAPSTRAAALLTAPSNLLSPRQGWAIVRLRPGFAAATNVPHGGNAIAILDWRTDANNLFALLYDDSATRQFYVTRVGASTAAQKNSTTQTFTLNQSLTVGMAGTASLIALLSGGAWTTQAHTAIPTLPSTFTIGAIVGAGGYEACSTYCWIVLGTGPYTSLDMTKSYWSSDTDPVLATINTDSPGAGVTAVIPFSDANILDYPFAATEVATLAALGTGVGVLVPSS